MYEWDEEDDHHPRASCACCDPNYLPAEGWAFRMYDGDGELYYSGRLVVSGEATRDDEEAMFGPLQDYGTPNAGAVDIRWAWDGWKSA